MNLCGAQSMNNDLKENRVVVRPHCSGRVEIGPAAVAVVDATVSLADCQKQLHHRHLQRPVN